MKSQSYENWAYSPSFLEENLLHDSCFFWLMYSEISSTYARSFFRLDMVQVSEWSPINNPVSVREITSICPKGISKPKLPSVRQLLHQSFSTAPAIWIFAVKPLCIYIHPLRDSDNRERHYPFIYIKAYSFHS